MAYMQGNDRVFGPMQLLAVTFEDGADVETRILGAVDEPKPSVGLAHYAIAGVKPQVPPRAHGLLGHRPVAIGERERLVVAKHQLAGRSVGHGLVMLVDDPGVEPGANRPHVAAPAVGGVFGGDRAVGLGRAVALDELDAEALMEALERPRRRIASLARSKKRYQPSASRTTRSPVWNHRFRHALTVCSGIAQ